MRSGQKSVAGFTLLELVLGMVVTGIVVYSGIAYVSAATKSIVRPVIIYGGNNYSLAPIFSDTNDGVAKTDITDAIAFHLEFARQTNASDMVAVFGGTAVNAGAPTPPSPILQTFSSLSLTSISSASPKSLTTVQKLAAAAATDLTGQYEAASGASDFTVLIFKGINTLTAIIQVRRYTSTFEGSAVALYETTMRARTLPSATWTTYAYRFWLPAAEDVWSLSPGARHYWYRNESTWWARSEGAGATLVFPDPYSLPINASDSVVQPTSRFSYFVPISP